jgi:hypothetical protein
MPEQIERFISSFLSAHDFSCLTTLARVCSMMLSRSGGEDQHLELVPHLRGMVFTFSGTAPAGVSEAPSSGRGIPLLVE